VTSNALLSVRSARAGKLSAGKLSAEASVLRQRFPARLSPGARQPPARTNRPYLLDSWLHRSRWTSRLLNISAGSG
jgi:hypothetical protein